MAQFSNKQKIRPQASEVLDVVPYKETKWMCFVHRVATRGSIRLSRSGSRGPRTIAMTTATREWPSRIRHTCTWSRCRMTRWVTATRGEWPLREGSDRYEGGVTATRGEWPLRGGSDHYEGGVTATSGPCLDGVHVDRIKAMHMIIRPWRTHSNMLSIFYNNKWLKH